MARGSFGAHVLSSERSASLVEVIQLGCICYIFQLIKQRLWNDMAFQWFCLGILGIINNILIINFFFFFWLSWVYVAARGLSPVAASRGHTSLWCVGPPSLWPLLLRSMGSRQAAVARGLQSTGSAVVAHGPNCSAACGIFPDQGSNPCPLHWQADSQPLHHQGSP